MVRRADIRKKKYEKGIDGDAIGKKFKKQKDSMVEQQGPYFAAISQVEAKVKKLCEAAGVSTMMVAQYVNTGRIFYSLEHRFSGLTRDNEADRIVTKWSDRGLDGTLLTRIATMLGCTPTPYTGPTWLAALIALIDDIEDKLDDPFWIPAITALLDDLEIKLDFLLLNPPNVGGVYGINIEALAAAKTLTASTDEIYQYLDPGAASRIITLSLVDAVAGDRFIIRHNGTYNNFWYLNVKQGAVFLDYIYASSVKEFIFNGANWISRGIGTGENDNKKYNLLIGYRAKGYDRGTALGYRTEAQTYGVGVGYQAKGYTRGVAIGYSARGNSDGVGIGYEAIGQGGVAVGRNAEGYDSGVGVGRAAVGYAQGAAVGRDSFAHTLGAALGRYAHAFNYGVAVGAYAHGHDYGVALGYNANTNLKKYSIALLYSAKCFRAAETAINIDGNAAQKNQVTQGRLAGTTDSVAATELFLGAIANERFTIRAQSALAFKATIVARDDTNNNTKAWKVEGLIKRDNVGNTSMVAVTHTVIGNDVGAAAWNAVFSADDANEALILTVTGAAGTTIQWAACIDGVETIF